MNFNLIKAGILPIAALCLSPACARARIPDAQHALCVVARERSSYINKYVSVNGLIETTSDGYHVYLIDNSCGSEDIALKIPNEYDKKSGIGLLVDHISQSSLAAMVGKRLHCICDGHVRRENSDIFLRLERVERVWVSE